MVWIFNTEVNLMPDPIQQTLTVSLHRLSNQANEKVVEAHCQNLTAAEVVFPGTTLRTIFKPVGSC